MIVQDVQGAARQPPQAKFARDIVVALIVLEFCEYKYIVKFCSVLRGIASLKIA